LGFKRLIRHCPTAVLNQEKRRSDYKQADIVLGFVKDLVEALFNLGLASETMTACRSLMAWTRFWWQLFWAHIPITNQFTIDI
jgi:hypothetical protein